MENKTNGFIKLIEFLKDAVYRNASTLNNKKFIRNLGEDFLVLNTVCCGRTMKKSDGYGVNEEITNFVCLECGHHLHVHDGELDKEELIEAKNW